MLLSDNLYKGITNSILLNSYNTNKCGLLGKAGYSLCLFEIFRHIKNKKLEEYAFEFLQEAINFNSNNLNEKEDIAYVILYLIKNRFIDASYTDLYENPHNEILVSIGNLNSEYNLLDDFNHLFFLYSTRKYISKHNKQFLSNLLIKNIHQNCSTLIGDNNFFYDYASKYLAFHNLFVIPFPRYNRTANIIIEFVKEMNLKNIVFQNLNFIFQFCLFAFCSKQENLIKLGENMISVFLKNFHPNFFSFQETINFIFYTHQITRLVAKDNDRIKKIENIRKDLNENISFFERKILNQNLATSELFGSVLIQLIILHIYWDSLDNPFFISKLSNLFNKFFISDTAYV